MSKASFPIFVNLHSYPLNPEDLEFLALQKLNLEFYFSGENADDLSQDAIEKTQGEVTKHGLKSIFHAPFIDLNIGAHDPKIREVSKERLLWAIKTAKQFGATQVVMHPGYGPWVLQKAFSKWLERAKPVLSDLVAKATEAGIRLAFENIYDDHPEDLLTLLTLFPKETVGVCFDVGHFNLFSRTPMKAWFDALAGRFFEVHLHDNSGSNDDHIAVGDGNIKFGSFITWLKTQEHPPHLTLEMEQKTHVIKSVNRLREWFADSGE